MDRMEIYESRMKEHRERFFSSINLNGLTPRQTVIAMLHLYSKGIRMTEPVPYWIKRAGIRCTEEGFSKVGKALAMHAEHEQDHHILYRNDFLKLQNLWKASSGETFSFNPAMDAGNLAVKNYLMLHEDLINGPYPYCQVAVELEIEGVSETIGKQIVAHIQTTLGPEYVSAMSFITEHAEIDVGHTRFNRGLLSELLKNDRAEIEALIVTGRNALATFGTYITQCINKGRKENVTDFLLPDSNETFSDNFIGRNTRKMEISDSVADLLEDANLHNDPGKSDELLNVMKAYLQAERSYSSRFS